MVCLPLFFLLALLAALGASPWLTALTVRYRDFRFIVPFLLQVGLFLTPVGFSTTNLPHWRGLFALNPMVGVIDGGFRWWSPFHGQQSLDPLTPGAGVATTLLLLVSALWYFRRTERTFWADII